MMFYICSKFCQSISYGFRVRDLNSRVDARVVAKVDGRTDVRTDIRKTRSLYRAMPEAGATKNKMSIFKCRWASAVYHRIYCIHFLMLSNYVQKL